MKSHGKSARPRGRPRTAANTALIAALIAKQDAMSRRTARKITAILDTHVSLEAAQIEWRIICRAARRVFGTIPDRALTVCPTLTDPDAVRRVLTELIRDALQELETDDGAPLPELPPEEKPPTVRRSRTLAEARAQLARLQVRLMETKARIVSAPDWWRGRQERSP